MPYSIRKTMLNKRFCLLVSFISICFSVFPANAISLTIGEVRIEDFNVVYEEGQTRNLEQTRDLNRNKNIIKFNSANSFSEFMVSGGSGFWG